MDKHLAISDIDFITHKPMKKTKFAEYPALKKKRMFFGIFTERPAFPKGWSEDSKGEPYYSERSNAWKGRYTTKQMEELGYVKEGLVWFIPAEVTITKLNGSIHKCTFTSDEDAKLWIETLKEKSKVEFEIIKA
jgi:hypothetical protein